MGVHRRRRNAAIAFGAWGLLLIVGLIVRSSTRPEPPTTDSVSALHQKILLLEEENAALRARLKLPEELGARVGSFKPLPARLCHVPFTSIPVPDLSPPRHSCLLDVGSRDGVGVGHGVISINGVVGRVAKVYEDHCRVYFADDSGFVAHFRLQRTPEEGIVQGDAYDEGMLRPSYLRNRIRFIDGDLLVTAGNDGVFPRGVALGVVTETANLPQDTRIQAAVDFGALTEVAVLIPPGE